MTQRTFRHFDDELDKLRTRLIKMGSVAFEQVHLAFRALLEENPELVSQVVDRDNTVDRYDVKIDRLCMRLLALQQPVARDLRSVMTALSMNNTLEYIGDLAVNIAGRVQYLLGHREMVHSSPFPRMAELVIAMLEKSFDAFVHLDVNLARQAALIEPEVDALDQQIFHYCVERMKESGAYAEPCSHFIILSRYAERLADNANLIAQDVVFLVEAKIVKHKNWSRPYDVFPSDEELVLGEGEI